MVVAGVHQIGVRTTDQAAGSRRRRDGADRTHQILGGRRLADQAGGDDELLGTGAGVSAAGLPAAPVAVPVRKLPALLSTRTTPESVDSLFAYAVKLVLGPEPVVTTVI